jgi:hypothetical protein
MFGWFNATPKALNKYCEIYTDRGLDVLVGNISPSQLIFSVKEFEVIFSKVYTNLLHFFF